LIVDYHMHLRAPDESIDHTVLAVERFVQAAAERGINEIGFSEHIYYFQETRPLWTVPYHVERCRYSLESYVDAVVGAKRQGMPVKLGLEVDFVPGREEETERILEPYPWDYLIGSIHFVDEKGIDGEPSLVAGVGVEEAWRRYYDTLGCAATSGLRHARSSRPGEDVRPRDFLGLVGRGEDARRRASRGFERRTSQAARQALSKRRAPRPGKGA
jgi:histidinol-phosphatase (PHP family)